MDAGEIEDVQRTRQFKEVCAPPMTKMEKIIFAYYTWRCARAMHVYSFWLKKIFQFEPKSVAAIVQREANKCKNT